VTQENNLENSLS